MRTPPIRAPFFREACQETSIHRVRNKSFLPICPPHIAPLKPFSPYKNCQCPQCEKVSFFLVLFPGGGNFFFPVSRATFPVKDNCICTVAYPSPFVSIGFSFSAFLVGMAVFHHPSGGYHSPSDERIKWAFFLDRLHKISVGEFPSRCFLVSAQ